MRSRTLIGGLLAVAACAASLVFASAASARVPDDPCPAHQSGAFTVDGEHDLNILPTHELYREHERYRECSPRVAIGTGDHFPRVFQCRHGFKLAGTSRHHATSHTAHWDFWARNGDWVTWSGSGEFIWRKDWAVAFHPGLINWNYFSGDNWPVRVFATCDRIQGYFGKR